jgi:biopolymer transport protein ExbB
VVLILERSIVLTVRSLGIQQRINQVIRLVQRGEAAKAEAACSKMRGATGSVLHAALTHRAKGRSVMEDAIQESLLHHAPKFHARLSFIALCAAVSPLTGLLGTVTGMITTFKMITLFGTSDPRFMAGGISEALITTQAGLCIAIPCLLLRGVLGAAADRAVARLETGAMSVVLAILQLRKKQPPAKRVPARSAP